MEDKGPESVMAASRKIICDMKIVITDGYTLNPGDLSWDGFKKFGEVVLYERTPADLILERCRDADVILSNKVPISASVMENAHNLKLISVTATGYNIIDMDAARRKNIAVCNVPNYGTYSVAQHTFALILEITNRVGVNSDSVRNGEWVRSSDFCYTKSSLMELHEKTLGIIGLGSIGMQVAMIARAFGMNVVYNSRTRKDTDLATFADLDTVFATSDIVSLHCPLTSGNREFVNARLLSLVKSSAFIINTSRGQLIHERDLADALQRGRLSGAALDVLSSEPPDADNPLIGAKNCLITPHTAWMSSEARKRILTITHENIDGFIKKKPKNLV